MKKFWVCCIMVLSAALSGCAAPQPETPDRPDAPLSGGEILDLSQANAPDSPEDAKAPDVPETPEPSAEPAPAPEEASSDQYVGIWEDPDAPEYRMEIGAGDEGGYAIEIRRSRGAQETDVWQLTGTYDEIWDGIAYTGARYTESADGERTPVPDREEISGLIYFEDDGALCWIDDFDHAGADLAFEKG